MLELSGTVLYSRPSLEAISHQFDDRRRDGQGVRLNIEVQGDPGLLATFDITPGIAEAQPLREVTAGTYVGTYRFADGIVGGPYALVGRLRHPKAGEVVLRDPDPITIALVP